MRIIIIVLITLFASLCGCAGHPPIRSYYDFNCNQPEFLKVNQSYCVFFSKVIVPAGKDITWVDVMGTIGGAAINRYNPQTGWK